MLNYLTRKIERFWELENSHYDKDPEQLSLTCDELNHHQQNFISSIMILIIPIAGLFFFLSFPV